MELIKLQGQILENQKLNKGQQVEKIVTEYYGLEYKLDNNNHLVSSDIEIADLKLSVKSKDCSLDNKTNHNDLENSIQEFITNDYSNTYAYVTTTSIENQLNMYLMNKEEFGKFLHQFASITSDKKFRIRVCDKKINTWFAFQ